MYMHLQITQPVREFNQAILYVQELNPKHAAPVQLAKPAAANLLIMQLRPSPVQMMALWK